MIKYLAELIYPTKCVLCQKPLSQGQLDLCPHCRANAPEYVKSKIRHSFIAQWTCLWYYKDVARRSILRYKFYYWRSYHLSYGRLLAMKLHQEGMDNFDILTWVPVSTMRRIRRGFDQSELLAQAVGRELQVSAVRTLKKIRHTKPLSLTQGAAARRASVIGAYQVLPESSLKGKRVLLLDDIITSGATASECAKMLLAAGAKEVIFAAIATAEFSKK